MLEKVSRTRMTSSAATIRTTKKAPSNPATTPMTTAASLMMFPKIVKSSKIRTSPSAYKRRIKSKIQERQES